MRVPPELRSDLELRAPSTALAGEPMEVEVTLLPQEDFIARQVRVELVGSAVYYEGGGEGETKCVP